MLVAPGDEQWHAPRRNAGLLLCTGADPPADGGLKDPPWPRTPSTPARSRLHLGIAAPGPFGLSLDGGTGEEAAKAASLPEWRRAEMSKAEVPKLGQPGFDGSALFRRVGGCPLFHQGDHLAPRRLAEGEGWEEAAIGPVTPLSGGVARPPVTRLRQLH